jgi:hypothetical protein
MTATEIDLQKGADSGQDGKGTSPPADAIYEWFEQDFVFYLDGKGVLRHMTEADGFDIAAPDPSKGKNRHDEQRQRISSEMTLRPSGRSRDFVSHGKEQDAFKVMACARLLSGPAAAKHGGIDADRVWWLVVITCLDPSKIIRRAIYQVPFDRERLEYPIDRPWTKSVNHGEERQIDLDIWPSWISTEAAPQSGFTYQSSMDQILGYWRDASTRIRESAKWMAAVIGAALAVLIGTSPLTKVAESIQPGWATVGALLLTVTLILTLKVLRPQATSYADVQLAGAMNGPSGSAVMRRFGARFPRSAAWMVRHYPLQEWRETVESQQDLYLLPESSVSPVFVKQ